MTQCVELIQPIDTPLEKIWWACTDTRGIAGWQADQASGTVARGGNLSLQWPALGITLDLSVIEVIAQKRLVLGNGRSRVAFELEPGRVRLEHDGLSDHDEAEGIASSWRVSLALLAHYCTRHAERSRQVRWLVKPARTSHELAHLYFTERAALATWLGRGEVGAEGQRYAIELGPGSSMSGTVLANTPGRDVALSWNEDDASVLCLRTLPHPASREQRVIVASWSRWGGSEPDPARVASLEAAHHRLIRAFDERGSA